MTKRALVLLAFALGCQKASIADATPDPSASAAVSPCASIVAKYDGLVATGGACSTDKDCACFNGGVSPKTGCGGVSDRTTATKLDQLRADYSTAKCGNRINCAAWACDPKCTSGRCMNR
jgi:hypothetical protein